MMLCFNPTYNQPENDKLAKEVLCEAFPTYEVVALIAVHLLSSMDLCIV